MNNPGVLDLNQLRRSCASCALHELCLPAGIDGDDLARLDATIRDKRTLDGGETLYRQGERFHALYVVRSGSLRTSVEDASGNLQVLGFHLPGEIVGVDALANDHHASQADALERSSICELPYEHLNRLLTQIPSLQRQLMRVISREVAEEHQHMVMMGRQPAQERLAIFLHSLSDRYARLQRDGTALNLPMSRHDIASYLGLAVETVSRLFTRMEEAGILAVSRKAVTILQPDELEAMCHAGRGGAKREGTA
jgi:CRP/FNR family transcriptional regulator